jgi:hypothetical protein
LKRLAQFDEVIFGKPLKLNKKNRIENPRVAGSIPALGTT